MINEVNKKRDIETIRIELNEVSSTTVKIHQINRSQEIRNNLSSILQQINYESYSYVLGIENYIKNNVKDASSLKKAIIEKIHANMGD